MQTDGRILSIDWRVALGLVLTTLWIGTGLVYLLGIVGWGEFVHLPTADIGSFLEGAFAPLAFLWLVIGHFMQQSEISANTRAIKLQEKSALRLERYSRQDSYFKLLTLVQEQLGGIAAFHYMSVAGPTGTGEISGDEFTEQRAISSSGDHAWFVRKMISLVITNREEPAVIEDILYGTDIRTRHSTNYINTFNKLLKQAEAVDTEDMMADALLNGSAHGLYYRMLRFARGDEDVEPFQGAVPMFREEPQTPAAAGDLAKSF